MNIPKIKASNGVHAINLTWSTLFTWPVIHLLVIYDTTKSVRKTNDSTPMLTIKDKNIAQRNIFSTVPSPDSSVYSVVRFTNITVAGMTAAKDKTIIHLKSQT